MMITYHISKFFSIQLNIIFFGKQGPKYALLIHFKIRPVVHKKTVRRVKRYYRRIPIKGCCFDSHNDVPERIHSCTHPRLKVRVSSDSDRWPLSSSGGTFLSDLLQLATFLRITRKLSFTSIVKLSAKTLVLICLCFSLFILLFFVSQMYVPLANSGSAFGSNPAG